MDTTSSFGSIDRSGLPGPHAPRRHRLDRPDNGFQRSTFGLRADMRISLQHSHGHVSRNGHDRFVARTASAKFVISVCLKSWNRTDSLARPRSRLQAVLKLAAGGVASNRPLPLGNTTWTPLGEPTGRGAYNRYEKLPIGGAALALPVWEKAVRSVRLDGGDEPVVIADYGSSQGKNALVPMQVAVKVLRECLGADRAISVFHVDQPSNDFNTLFEVLAVDPERYGLNDRNVFPGAIGRSFYELVLPAGSVHLGWCYAAVWLSRIPALIPGHIVSFRAMDAVREEFERQAVHDWETFPVATGEGVEGWGTLGRPAAWTR